LVLSRVHLNLNLILHGSIENELSSYDLVL
jgi:hypothetical protein